MINLAWDNNAYYQPRLLRALPARCARVLGVGCGAARFAERAGQVDAVDRSADVIEAAKRSVPPNVTCILGDIAEMTLPAQALRLGGDLIGISHHRVKLPRDLPVEAMTVLASNARRHGAATGPVAL